MKPKLIIWDWNGTLLDDVLLCYGIANEMRVRRGIPPFPDAEAYRGAFSFPIVDYYKRAGYSFETETYEAVSVEFVALYMQRVRDCPLHAGTFETLERVRALGVRQALLSATGQDRLDEQMELFTGLRAHFEAVLGMPDNLAHGKAARARQFIAACGCAPEETLFIGDTDHDHEVADALGCGCALLLGGHQSRERLAACGVPVLSGIRAVPDYLASLK